MQFEILFSRVCFRMPKLTEASKERIKLAASAFSNLAVGITVTTIFAPLAALAISDKPIHEHGWRIPVIVFIGLLISVALYYVADLMVAKLETEEE